MSPETGSAAFPVGGRRLIVHAAREVRGDVSPTTEAALRGLRPHAEVLVVVAHGVSRARARSAWGSIADRVIVGRGRGGDDRAHRAGLARLGDEARSYDEVILTADSWVGPVGSFAPLFHRMDSTAADAWGMVRNGAGGAFARAGWFAARRRMVASPAWRKYWAGGPKWPGGSRMAPHVDAAATYFENVGFDVAAAFIASDLPGRDVAARGAARLLADGCPIVVRGVFDGESLERERLDLTGRRAMHALSDAGYPVQALRRDLVRTVAPRTLYTRSGAMEVLTDGDCPDTAASGLRVLVVVHAARLEGVRDLLKRAAWVPGSPHIVATVADPSYADPVASSWRKVDPENGATFEVRPAPGRTGPDTAVVFAECRDLLASYDLVVAIHTGTWPGAAANTNRYLRRHSVENLLSSPAYARALVGLFDRDPGLGLVFPPVPHIGTSVLGDGWRRLRRRARDVARGMGIRVPLDQGSPLAPFAGMWAGRPDALQLLATRDWPAADLPLLDVHTRMHAYAAGERGYETRTVINPEHAGISQSFLEYELDQMSAALFGRAQSPTQFLRRAARPGVGWALRIALARDRHSVGAGRSRRRSR
jgi:lipopolysaccharide biosynthesis protein